MARKFALGRGEPIRLLLIEGVPHEFIVLSIIIGDHKLNGILETA
jgi:hypothetical protein